MDSPLFLAARQLVPGEDWQAIAAWCGGRLIPRRDVDGPFVELRIDGTGGWYWTAFAGDWVVRTDEGFKSVPGDEWKPRHVATRDDLIALLAQELRAGVARYHLLGGANEIPECGEDDWRRAAEHAIEATVDDIIEATRPIWWTTP